MFTIALFVYLVYCMACKRPYASWTLNALKVDLVYFLWICYNPMLECLVMVNKCDSNGKQEIDKSLGCYSAFHIALMTFSILLLLCAIAIGVLTSILYQRTHPISEDTLAQYEPAQ